MFTDEEVDKLIGIELRISEMSVLTTAGVDETVIQSGLYGRCSVERGAAEDYRFDTGASITVLPEFVWSPVKERIRWLRGTDKKPALCLIPCVGGAKKLYRLGEASILFIEKPFGRVAKAEYHSLDLVVGCEDERLTEQFMRQHYPKEPLPEALTHILVGLGRLKSQRWGVCINPCADKHIRAAHLVALKNDV